MRVAWVVPGGVARSGEGAVVDALLWMIERVARRHDLQIVALRQESEPGDWELLGARVHNVGARPRRLGAIRWLVSEHGRAPFDVIHSFWAIPQGVVAVAAGGLLGVPVVVDFTGGELASLPDREFGGSRTARGRMWLRLAGKGADRITCWSEFQRRQAREQGYDAVRVPYGVDPVRWPSLAPRSRDLGAPARLLQAATLNLVKDQETLLRACARLRDWAIPFTLDLVGEDTLGGRIQALARALGLDEAVRFHGFVPRPALRALMERADLALITSRYESGCTFALEAAMAGVPLAGSAVGFIADWSPHAASTVPPGDPVALAGAIRDLLCDEPRRMAMARAAYDRARAHDADGAVAAIEAIYAQLTHGTAGGSAHG